LLLGRQLDALLMAQIFPPSMNVFAKATIFGAVFILSAVGGAAAIWVRSPYMTQVNVVRDQPVPFSHDHHVSGLGIDCRYCHASVETSAFAGLPATETCMGCHSQIWKDSPLLEPVRSSFRTGQPLAWTRVHDLPDFAYFNHSIHIAKGIGCESCHGPVDRMPLMRKSGSLLMEWCLDCHRHPEDAVRPKNEVFAFMHGDRFGQGVKPQATTEFTESAAGRSRPSEARPVEGHPAETRPAQALTGAERVKQYGIVKQQLSDCAICHR
jgi:hypothetical protein